LLVVLAACTTADRSAMTDALKQINQALAPLAVFKAGTQ